MDPLIHSLLTEIRRGNLTLAVLSQLRSPQYGYSLVQLLKELGVVIEQSTLYPLLRRLEKQKLVTSFWDKSDKRPRKYYQLSGYGEEVFHQLRKEWMKNTKKLYGVLSEGEGEHEFD
ncbi:DNA-binding transcriptional regulator, PadR family [Salinibacillus kushneri]|uniref:DNA-binding transcriptional regulator, PadR family n=1 Tax=Salinibacillus kushneri TaxID=237682 RepID=A0A1I0GVA5_9BACI|nr:PadR family transcriptional regulator [Salinibacillus kushneri]SET74219.1 DNA-binding transcriptional regulator, PadR family [Salinibacillus kushneri]